MSGYTPELDAKTLFEHLLGGCGEWIARAGGALRTFQRRVKQCCSVITSGPCVKGLNVTAYADRRRIASRSTLKWVDI